jgi:hypothetical protein
VTDDRKSTIRSHAEAIATFGARALSGELDVDEALKGAVLNAERIVKEVEIAEGEQQLNERPL